MTDSQDPADDHEAVDEAIRRRIAELRERGGFAAELLAEGQSVVVMDDEGRVVRVDPDGTRTVLE